MLAFLLALSFATFAVAQDIDDEKDAALSRWPFFVELAPANVNAKDAKFAALDLPETVLGKATSGLADLRLVDATGQRLPYALRIERTSTTQTPIAIERRFDAGPTGSAYEESFELAPVPLPGHNDIEIVTSGHDFRRPVQVFGSNTPDFAKAQTLLPDNTFLVRFTVEGKLVSVDRFRYQYKLFRFLKVRVEADPYRKEKPPIIDRVVVRQSEKTVGRYTTFPVRLAMTDGVRAEGGPGTAYTLDLGPERRYVEKLSILLEKSDAVERPLRLQVADRGEMRQDVFGVEQRFRTVDGRKFLDLTFNEVYAQTLRLVITDYANPPIQFSEISATAAVRRIIFERPEAAVPSLKLYFGNPTAIVPNYDIARRLPPTITPAPAEFTAGPRLANPGYIPPEPEFAERHPWVIYGVLTFACLVLAALLVPLARRTVALAKPV